VANPNIQGPQPTATHDCPSGAYLCEQAQQKPAPKSKLVLSSPDAQLAAKVPEVYTANLFGCTGGNMSPRCSGPSHPLERCIAQASETPWIGPLSHITVSLLLLAIGVVLVG
jgi:hypothetical protein